MMLWVNLIMDTMGALALGTEPPSSTLLDRKPLKRDASLISLPMIRNIAVQSLFQIGLLAYLMFGYCGDFGCAPGSARHNTIIFNTFVFCQIFNEFNARSIGDEVDVFKGLHKNGTFLAIIAFTVATQYALVQYAGDFVRTERLGAEEWKHCMLLAALSLPLGGLMRLLPAQESADNYAVLPRILQHKAAEQEKRAAAAPALNAFTPTLFVWLVAAAAIPAMCFQEFGAHWSAHAAAWLGSFASQLAALPPPHLSPAPRGSGVGRSPLSQRRRARF